MSQRKPLPDDVEPVSGEEAQSYQSMIVEGVSKQMGGDEVRLQEFVTMTRNYGKGEVLPSDFYAYLTSAFGDDKAYAFLPKLARLIADRDKRQALLKAPLGEAPPPAYAQAVAEDASAVQEFTNELGDNAPPPPPPLEDEEELDLQSLAPDVRKVKEMFPDIPIPAIQAALQQSSCQHVIEKALVGQLDVNATPSVKPTPQNRVSGNTVSIAVARERFPSDVLPSHMLPRELARLQDLFPRESTSLLQAELQVTSSVQFAMETLLTDQVHAEVLSLDPVPVALRGYLVKSDPGGKNFTRRFFILRQLTGSLCYARVPEDMDDPLGVIYLFNSRLSGASSSSTLSVVKNKFPSVHIEAGFCLVTPHRTYQLFANSVPEAEAWKNVLRHMQTIMVPPEFETGDDVVECEVFENERYGIMSGWGPNFWPGDRLTFSNRKGELSSSEFPEFSLPGGFKWEDDWHIDHTYTSTDAEGWCYAGSFSALESDLEHGNTNAENRMMDQCRRRRWVRTCRRVIAKPADPTKDQVLVNFGKSAADNANEGADGGMELVADEEFGVKGGFHDDGL